MSISSPGQIHTEARGRGWIAFSVASPPNFLGWHSVEIWPSPPPHGNKSRGALQCLVLWVPGINCRLSEACAVRTVLMEPSSQPIRENVLDKGGSCLALDRGDSGVYNYPKSLDFILMVCMPYYMLILL